MIDGWVGRLVTGSGVMQERMPGGAPVGRPEVGREVGMRFGPESTAGQPPPIPDTERALLQSAGVVRRVVTGR